jgi:Na+/H+-dicarboxylate symporter
MAQDFQDLTIGLAATLNLNGTLICCLVLVPAVCLTIGYPLTVSTLLGCLPLIFFLGYAIPGIPGELVIFADPIAGALGLGGAERHLFLVLFLTWQVGLTDAFRSAGSATDGVPATLLLNRIYHSRFGDMAARKWIAGNAAFAETIAPPHVRLASNRIESGHDGR